MVVQVDRSGVTERMELTVGHSYRRPASKLARQQKAAGGDDVG